MGLAGGKYFIKIIFDIKIKIGIFEYQIKFAEFQSILSILNFGTNLGLTGSIYLIKIILGIKIETSIVEISNGQISINSEHFLFWDQFGPNNW